MKRLLFATLVLVGGAMNQGCQSCCAPHDYSPPVANCNCAGCGNHTTGRAGSIISGAYTNTSHSEIVSPHAEYYAEGEMQAPYAEQY